MRIKRLSGPVFLCLLVLLYAGCACGKSQNGDAELIIAFSGEETGYLEPCGCEQTRTGGIAKRHSLFLSMQGENQTIFPVSLGDLTSHRKRQDEIKMETLLHAMGDMKYTLHNLGEKDLEMGPEALGYAFYPSPVRLLSSNVVLPDTPGVKVYPYITEEVKVGDRTIRIGFLGILSPKLLGGMSSRVKIIPPSEAIAPIIKELRDADLLILLSHAGFEESRKLAEAFPEFQLVISGHNSDHPEVVNIGNTIVAAAGSKGKNIGLFRYRIGGGKGSLDMVELGDSYADSRQMQDLLDNYQQRLRDEDLLGRVDKFPYEEGSAYAGSVICGACHREIFLHWETTPHAPAYETLVRVRHDYDPECVACHVTGLLYESGFTSPEETPGLKGVGCEGCHGPGGRHVDEAQKGLKTADYGRVRPGDCETCHDIEHSSQFQYENYWQKITHPKEKPKG